MEEVRRFRCFALLCFALGFAGEGVRVRVRVVMPMTIYGYIIFPFPFTLLYTSANFFFFML